MRSDEKKAFDFPELWLLSIFNAIYFIFRLILFFNNLNKFY